MQNRNGIWSTVSLNAAVDHRDKTWSRSKRTRQARSYTSTQTQNSPEKRYYNTFGTVSPPRISCIQGIRFVGTQVVSTTEGEKETSAPRLRAREL